MRYDEERVGDNTDGSGIEDYVVEVVTQLFHKTRHVVAQQQFVGIGRHGAGRKHKEILAFSAGVNERLNVADLSGKECGDTLLIGETKLMGEHGTADVHAYDNHFLAGKGIGHCQVGGNKGLALARYGRCDEYHFLIAAILREAYIIAEKSEKLGNGRRYILPDNDRGGFLGGIDRNLADNGDIGEALQFLLILKYREEEALKEDDTSRNTKAEKEGDEVDDYLARADRSLAALGVVDKTGGRRGEGLLQSDFLAFLEQECIDIDLDLLFAEYFLKALVDWRQ